MISTSTSAGATWRRPLIAAAAVVLIGTTAMGFRGSALVNEAKAAAAEHRARMLTPPPEKGGTVDDGFLGFAPAENAKGPLEEEWRKQGCVTCPDGGFCCPALGCKITETVLIGGNEATYQTNLWVEHGNFPWYAYPAIPVLSFTHPVWTFLQINKERQHNLARTRALSLQEWWLYCFQNNAGDSDGDGMPDYADEEHNP